MKGRQGMAQQIKLSNGRTVTVPDFDIGVDHNENELSFCYQGISNDVIGEKFLLCRTEFDFERNAELLGDGFQMLAQTAGTFADPIDVGRCPDNGAIYRLYPSCDPKRYYNYLVIESSAGYSLFGFTSCQRFSGYFEIKQRDQRMWVNAYIDGENTHPQDWASNDFESIVFLQHTSLSKLFDAYAKCIEYHHPKRSGVTLDAPIGWCSWYAYYADVTEQNVLDNLNQMHGGLSPLDYVLIDDGYQAFMGDWLTPSDKFPEGVQSVIQAIKEKGKKPAIWLAPFIAQPDSKLFRDHPSWFVKNQEGSPLKAEDITYSGWRCTPWYMLDMSNPAVQDHITSVIRTMREDWGIELFKLDANYWGALKGMRHQSGITGVEAYRMGMDAIAQGAGDAFILGCNAPMWPSLGLVDAMRVSDDVERSESRFEQIAKETFYRSWQHRRLWQIDPDCATLVSLSHQTTDPKHYEFHRTVLLASGGVLLSGDPLPELTPFASKSLAKLIIRHRHCQEAARFTALNLHHACLRVTEQNVLHCLFNFHQPGREVTLTSEHPVHWYDYWTGEKLFGEPTQIAQVYLADGLSSRAIITSI